MDHVVNGGEMEDFFNLSGDHFEIFDKKKDHEKKRDCAWVGSHKKGWLMRFEEGEEKCETNTVIFY